MAVKTLMSIGEFLKKVLEEAFILAEEHFALVEENRKKKMVRAMFAQLGSVVPESFLNLLETIKNPRTIVINIFEGMANNPPPYQVRVEPGELDKDHVLQEFAVQTVHHIAAMIFIAPPEVSQYSPFMEDIKNLHDFLRQKQAASIIKREAETNGEIGETRIDFGPDDKTKLITEYSRSLISIPALIKKVANPETNPGQYL